MLTLGKDSGRSQMDRRDVPPGASGGSGVQVRSGARSRADCARGRLALASQKTRTAQAVGVRATKRQQNDRGRLMIGAVADGLQPIAQERPMPLKVQNGTVSNSESSLCNTCRLSTIVRGRTLDEEIVQCHALLHAVAARHVQGHALFGIQRRAAPELSADARARVDPAARIEEAARPASSAAPTCGRTSSPTSWSACTPRTGNSATP